MYSVTVPYSFPSFIWKFENLALLFNGFGKGKVFALLFVCLFVLTTACAIVNLYTHTHTPPSLGINM